LRIVRLLASLARKFCDAIAHTLPGLSSRSDGGGSASMVLQRRDQSVHDIDRVYPAKRITAKGGSEKDCAHRAYRDKNNYSSNDHRLGWEGCCDQASGPSDQARSLAHALAGWEPIGQHGVERGRDLSGSIANQEPEPRDVFARGP
jgi:hypothetical protein